MQDNDEKRRKRKEELSKKLRLKNKVNKKLYKMINKNRAVKKIYRKTEKR